MDHHEARRWPEERDSQVGWLRQAFDRWTFSYMNEILDRDKMTLNENGENLSVDDLFPVPSSMESASLANSFRKLSQTEKHQADASLLTTLWSLAKPTFIPAGFCQLLTVVCQVAIPLLVRELLSVLEDNPGVNITREGMPFAVSIFLVALLNGFATHRQRHLAMKTGIVLRATMVSVLYQHVLLLSPQGRTGLTSGEVTNLVAVDTQKLFEVTQEGHLVWSLPLSTALVTIFLILIMGPITLVGVAVLVAFVPMINCTMAAMTKIRKERVKSTDARVEATNMMLQGIKVTKLNNYEEKYINRVKTAREKELQMLRKELAVWAMTLVITVCSPVVATAFTFSVYVLMDEENILTASKTFSVLLLFAALRFPINYAGRLLSKASQAWSAMERIAAFMQREKRESDTANMNMGDSSTASDTVTLRNSRFFSSNNASEHENESRRFEVSEFDISLRKGDVLAICGPVGSGKSTFVNGIIGEVPATKGSVVELRGKVALVPQVPFIINASLRENILFGLPFDQLWYDKVLEACCLYPDIEQLGSAGDATEIGERGVTLSGGQKQRVSLARAAYARPDLVVLDDPLSALDAGTAQKIFELVIRSKHALFAKTAVLLVTHASHFLHKVDRITIIVDGTNKFLGTWRELLAFDPDDEVTRSAVSVMVSSNHDVEPDPETNTISLRNDPKKPLVSSSAESKLMSSETREQGLSSLSVWFLWFKHAGGWYFLVFQVVFMAIDRFFYVMVEFWLARWTKATDSPIDELGIEFSPQSDGISSQSRFVVVYIILLVLSVLSTTIRSQWAVTGGSRAARRVFDSMLNRVLYAPMSYFETTPLGRILNRFSFDMEVIDVLLTQVMSMFLISCSWYVAGVVLMSSILPWMLAAIVPVTITYYFLLLHYRRTGADLQRLDAVSRSPLQAMTSEVLDGTSSIRVFEQEKTFLGKFYKAVDVNSSALLNFVSGQRWLGLRIELLGSLIVLVSTVLVIRLNNSRTIDPGLVGLLILWSGNFTITLSFLVDTFAETEAHITAIERVDAMAEVPQERAMITSPELTPTRSWPECGELEFRNVSLRYRKGLPIALNKLSFKIPPGTRCGVVGRTGAGKSSLTVALFRIVEIESGSIWLDGIDLSTLGLRDVRGRPNGMSIIPQDPFLAGTTLRECLDPFGKAPDDKILEALVSVRLAKTSDSVSLLDKAVEEGGSNFSVGERQLLTLAGALLSQPKLLVLDEATASIDYETDEFVQKLLRTRFNGCTILTVAHRLPTIMDYDLILVMDKGRLVEMDSPLALLDKDGMFSELVSATGPEGARALREMAREDR